MGGRLDATNVLLPRAAVITRIALDHKEYLGETLAAIAAEKAGIIKEGIPLVSAAQQRDAGEVIRSTAAERRAPLFVFGDEFAVVRSRVHAAGIALDYRGGGELRNIAVPLPGRHQLENTALALKTCELIAREAGLSSEGISEGIGKVRWPGRLELITYPEKRFDMLVDGAHNPDAAEALAEALKTIYLPLYARILLVLGVMADKDVDGIMEPLLPISTEVILAAPAYARAATAETLLGRASALGFRATAAPSVREALNLAAARAASPSMPDGRSLIVITGSFYTIGEAEAALGHVGVLTGLRE
jgi:dihydrofolate synthase/folylpolyglutamate synthase